MKINKFSKPEIISIFVIFSILIVVAVPNFFISLRRARDQVRRDDLGALVHALDNYHAEFGVFPPSSTDGKIMNCLSPGDTPYKDEKGNWVINPIPCEWGKDAFNNLISGVPYMTVLPRDPRWEDGASYLYISDQYRYQLFATMEGKNEAEIDQKIISENLKCGENICNVGRYYACEIPKTLQQCEEEASMLKK